LIGKTDSKYRLNLLDILDPFQENKNKIFGGENLIMKTQQRILKFVTRTNWILLSVASIVGLIISPLHFAIGIIFGGLIVTISFHLLYRSLKEALTPPHLASLGVIVSKYYIRFIVSALIIFILISRHYVHPVGLLIGLSIVYVSITLATMYEFKRLIFKEVT